MFKKIFVVLAMMGLMMPSLAFAQYGLDKASKGTGLIKGGQTIDAEKTVPELIGTIVGVVLSFLGAIFFLLILYAGFLWMTAFGAADKVDKAKSILEHAAVGLLIVLGAYAISRFVFRSLTGGSNSGQVTTPTTSECERRYPRSETGGVGFCIERSDCEMAPGTIHTGLCPGGANIICCVI